MEFEHEGHWTLYQRVRDCLERELGDDFEPVDQEPAFVVKIGEVPLLVSVQGAGPKAVVTVFGRPASEIGVTPEIALFLLRANFGHDVPFGAFGLNDDNVVSFSHVLMGEGFDDESFSLLLHLLASKVDDVARILATYPD